MRLWDRLAVAVEEVVADDNGIERTVNVESQAEAFNRLYKEKHGLLDWKSVELMKNINADVVSYKITPSGNMKINQIRFKDGTFWMMGGRIANI